MKPLRIALTKGRLEKTTIELFQKIGYNCDEVINKGRRLILPIGDNDFEVVLAKAADVITYVEIEAGAMAVACMVTVCATSAW